MLSYLWVFLVPMVASMPCLRLTDETHLGRVSLSLVGYHNSQVTQRYYWVCFDNK